MPPEALESSPTGTATIIVHPPRHASPTATNTSARGPFPLVTRADIERPYDHNHPQSSLSSAVPLPSGPPRTNTFDSRSAFTINHLKIELSSTTRELECVQTILNNEREDWNSRAYLFEEELVGLRGEVAYLRHLLATAGVIVGSGGG